MLKDIKNMGSKRPNSIDTAISAVIMNAYTGAKYDFVGHQFVIGRARSCSIVIEELYISRIHCIIELIDGQYFIKDNNTSAGTYVNCKLLPKENHYSVVLKHGDLISFSNEIKYYVYKFCLSSKTDKKLKFDDFVEKEINNETKIESAHKPNDEYLKTLNTLKTGVSDLKIDNVLLKITTKNKIYEIQKAMDESVQSIKKSTSEVFNILKNQKAVVNNLSKKVSEYSDALKKQQETKTVEKEKPLEVYKTKLHDLLENDCQCPICNEVILKAHTANCHHTFCEGCISKWLSLKKFCPVCRSVIKTTHYCLIMDNFISNLCDFLGGASKHQRDALKQERSSVLPVSSRGRRNVARRGRRAVRPALLPPVINLESYNSITAEQPVVIVDLTNSFASNSAL